ncbi:hypothetical protein [Phycicoccus sp.]|uniref:hypothetical protein n=1 Tax=Phycicoccus sp. TaxID=1902410 RepID=UPI002CC23417|nr:hypothetical protein [Phycicoccus sp.]HMM95310.1 hypothetical protein [Phycicoccus sp.]
MTQNRPLVFDEHLKRWVPAEPIGWQEEHGPLARLVLRALGRPHCGKPGRDGRYAPGEAPAGSVPLVSYERAVHELTEAIRHTVEYVGVEGLPPIDGWSWYDAMRKYAPDTAAEFLREWQSRKPAS